MSTPRGRRIRDDLLEQINSLANGTMPDPIDKHRQRQMAIIEQHAAQADRTPLGSPESNDYLRATAETLVHTLFNSRLPDSELISVVEQILRRAVRHHLP